MTITWRLYSCDEHLDLWNLPRDLWEGRLPARLRERGPRVVEQGGNAWWTCDGSVLGPFGTQMMKDYSAIARAGIEDLLGYPIGDIWDERHGTTIEDIPLGVGPWPLSLTPLSHLYYDRDPGFICLVGDELRRVLAAVR